ncbi:hypothetical protein F5X97DRAFT_297017 [Nemania serpens]|nr:hypothetical protein F5X97DRAFT_297017 [Nemania serpens]
MYHCGERYYAAWLGRWASPDPIGIADGLNRYRYVKNDPINFYDSSGTSGRGRGAGHHGAGQHRPPRPHYHPYGLRGHVRPFIAPAPVRPQPRAPAAQQHQRFFLPPPFPPPPPPPRPPGYTGVPVPTVPRPYRPIQTQHTTNVRILSGVANHLSRISPQLPGYIENVVQNVVNATSLAAYGMVQIRYVNYCCKMDE